jgi:hypothetical protein
METNKKTEELTCPSPNLLRLITNPDWIDPPWASRGPPACPWRRSVLADQPCWAVGPQRCRLLPAPPTASRCLPPCTQPTTSEIAINNKNQIKTRDLKGLHAWGMEGDPDLGSLRGLRRRDIVTRPRTRPRVLRGRRCRRCRHIGFSISGGRRVAGLARRLCGRFRTGGFRGGGFRDGGERAGVRLRRVSQGQAGSGACATSVRAVRRVSRRRRACGRSVAAGFAGAGRAVAGGIG